MENNIYTKYSLRMTGRLVLLGIILMVSSCEKYLTVDPIDRLTGNNFYLSKADVETNFAFIYSRFFEKIRESWVLGATGEARSGEMRPSTPSGDSRTRPLRVANDVVLLLGSNNLLSAINSVRHEDYQIGKITDWKGYYEVIQSTNVLISKLEEGIPGVSGADQTRYIAEAKFMRAFTYFWMVRLYGDVVYYTEPYYRDKLPREDMVSVLNKCIADLEPQKDLMPWTHDDPAQRGARPAKGAIIALLMHMNAWSASFDRANSRAYHTEMATLGQELVASGAHRLYPMTEESWALVSKGRTEESLFEFYRSVNYGDATLFPEEWDRFDVRNHYMVWSHFLRWPYVFPRHDKSISPNYYTALFMNRLYPEGEADLRRELWFDDIDADDGRFSMKKFGLNVYSSGNEPGYPENSIIIFRYADAILLYAEALAELDRDAEAVTAVNMIRERSEAALYVGGGGTELKDFIFAERNRELFGEAHRYFDLVRTRRILSSQWAAIPMNMDEYNRGAWTWPLHRSARDNNPNIVLNEYWTNIGR